MTEWRVSLAEALADPRRGLWCGPLLEQRHADRMLEQDLAEKEQSATLAYLRQLFTALSIPFRPPMPKLESNSSSRSLAAFFGVASFSRAESAVRHHSD